ncbi:class I SAM-dependent methyltransferase [Streptomyces pseudovenezuelae]|uniref:Ubiquinone/menaquinone biosynthesis C-methylase UbiE n=1 Tax=Streptomyces pseudovenezuelae TaxID=67350 RepID=A0ABT6LD89_9ACTN|nr:class I SAM-dependent methyltransferase [Streptomyces pseudovenezuelae]MDH6213344.1 ubiquinone/menaquinone biosynthesis C-methylase UbiE [Streptomyces pseudovenezuelae]
MYKTAEVSETSETRQKRYDVLVGGANDALFAGAGIKLADRVLDVGCGTGATTRIAARLAARGHVVGVDTSVPLLRRARARMVAEKIRNAAYMEADPQVHPFPRAGYDVVISRGGVMFFTDPAVAFANLARALLPGGRLAFVCPEPLSDPDRIRADLRDYENVTVRGVPVETVWGGDNAAFAVDVPHETGRSVRLRGDIWLVTAKRPR